jgi:hypothetical protein
MSTNRRTRSWPLKAEITPGILTLFVELEGMSDRDPKFKAGSRRLAELLGLTDEWWSGQHVNDASAGPCHPPGYVAHGDWYTCRRVRDALLAAAGSQKQTSPTKIS